MTDWREKEAKYFMRTGKRMDLLAVRGEGSHIWDEDGREYLDFFGGPATISLGHSHPGDRRCADRPGAQLIHVSNQFYSIPQLKLAELLIEHSCFDRVYFMNSGAEANEGALKLARKWGKEKKAGAYEIICADDAFHGRTLQAVTAGGTERYKTPFGPLPEGFVHVPFNDVEAVKRATIEQHGGGVHRADPGRGRHQRAGRRLLQAAARVVRRAEHPADLRRGADGLRAARHALRVRALRRRAGHHDAGQGHRRRRAAVGVPGEGALRGVHAGRPRQHVRRRAADDARRLRGDAATSSTTTSRRRSAKKGKLVERRLQSLPTAARTSRRCAARG